MRLFIFLLVLTKMSDQGVPFYDGNSGQEKVLSCLNRIVKRHFDSEHQVTILSQGSKDYVDGIKTGVRMVATTSEVDKTLWFPETKQAIVFLDGDFHRDVKILMSLGTFHPRSRFMIVCTNYGWNRLSVRNYLIKVVDHLHKNRRRMVAIVLKSIDDDLRIYGYTKTAPGKCDQPEIMDFGYCSRKNVDALFSTTDLNYNQCPLKVATYDWPPLTHFVIKNGQKTTVGIESQIVQCILERLNASQSLLEAPPSKIRIIVRSHDADIGYGQMAVYEGNEFSYTNSYGVLKGAIIVPKYPASRYGALNNLIPFEMTVWVALLLVVILVIILRIFLPDLKQISMFSIWSIFLGYSVKMRCKRTPLRIYFISLVWFGYIVTQAYLANLTMIFTKSSNQGEIGSLDELDKSTIRIGGVRRVADMFLKEKYPRLYADFVVMNLTQFVENLKKLETGGDLGAFVEISRFSPYNYWKTITIVPEVVTSYPVAMLVPNTSSVLPTCDVMISSIFEAGLMDQWAADWERKYKKLAADAITDESDRGTGNMGLQQFLEIFGLLGIGLGFCTNVFIGELVVANCRPKKKR